MSATIAIDAAVGSSGRTARGLVASELSKLTSTRVAGWFLLASAALTALVVSGAAVSGAAIPIEALGTEAGLRTVLEHGGVAAFLPLALGILASAGEYRNGTVIDTLLTEPRRVRVLAAKVAAGAAYGALAGVVLAVMTAAAVTTNYALKDVPLDLASATVARSLAGIVVWATLYAVIGVAAGTIIRNPAAAIVSVAVWLFGAESAVAALLVDVGRWLPGTAARALGNASLEGALSQTGGGVVLLGWSGAALLVAAVLTRRRDVT